jgi:murein DD-endopeptidase MepM/ murein hydrolase activator NlpD
MKKRYVFVAVMCLVFGLGFLIPEPKIIPVQGATETDWNKDTFWYEPWGSSGVHKGVDIFAPKGRSVIASTNLLVLYRGSFKKGGRVIVALGPKWRAHYFAHLDSIDNGAGIFISAGSKIGTVGDSGNAKGKPPHLHYSLASLIPRPWAIDGSTQGYQKALYINPIIYLLGDNK